MSKIKINIKFFIYNSITIFLSFSIVMFSLPLILSKKSNDIYFDTSVDYGYSLEQLRKIFRKNWHQNEPSPSTNLEDFKVITALGKGAFGKVKLVKHNFNDEYYAVKVMQKEEIVKNKQITNAYNEKRVLQSICFPFVVNLEWSRKDNEAIYMGMPFMAGGDLFRQLRKMRSFTEKHAQFYAAQVFLGLEYLHYLDLVYRDLKPENLLLDTRGYIKITDFGFCKRVETRTLTLCGTPEYMAPEILLSKPYGASVDWWSFGILIFEMVYGSSTFSPHNKETVKMYNKICAGEYKMPKKFGSDLKDLVTNLLKVEVSQRLGCFGVGDKDIKAHAWFDGISWMQVLNQVPTAPYIPKTKSAEDLSHFNKFKEKPTPKSNDNKYETIFSEF